ncbi:hypothetical protein [Bacteroides sp. 519]|uniref:hypothetical protein n=1 Tax=Bacteroides sp. 519 TaxID=2302937 RepID=UPI0013D2862C|nr:hypothetical protein [Bacteroides sp. 519]NDV60554.1 hypothetical protein [Bacteroides sp. 519]
MLKQTLIFATIILLTSCGQSKQPTNKHSTKEALIEENVAKETPKEENKVDNALIFINGYTENANKLNESLTMIEWVELHKGLTTQSFRLALKKIIDDAYQEDPELGLGFDPVFDAQDYPDKGFEVDSFDEQTNHLTVRGKDWPDFKVTMRVVKENEQWLVDGCGVVNMP